MELAFEGYKKPEGKKHVTTKLWAKAEEVARITAGPLFTEKDVKRWLRYGYPVLERALIYLSEKPDVRKKGAFLTWAIKHYHNEQKAGVTARANNQSTETVG